MKRSTVVSEEKRYLTIKVIFIESLLLEKIVQVDKLTKQIKL